MNATVTLNPDVDFQNSSETWVPVFLRTTPNATMITWGIIDDLRNDVVPRTETQLTQHMERRLAEWVGMVQEPRVWDSQRANRTMTKPQVEALQPDTERMVLEKAASGVVFDSAGITDCEQFFLLDGRRPVDLPDTWGEARQAFGIICEDGGSSLETCRTQEAEFFKAFGHGNEEFVASPDFCMRLLAHASTIYSAAALKPRRLKASGGGGGFRSTSSGSAGASGYTGTRSYQTSAATSYGYTSGSMGSTFPRGYTSTSYGYSGRFGRAAIVGGAGLWFFGGARYGSYNSGAYGRTGGCDDEKKKCQVPDSDIDGLYRDDFMEFGIVPNQEKWPLVLTVSSISGYEYELCPPPGWNGETPFDPNASLLFGFAKAEAMEWVEDDNIGVIVGPIVVCLLCCCCVCVCCWMLRKKRAKSKDSGREHQEGGCEDSTRTYGQRQ